MNDIQTEYHEGRPVIRKSGLRVNLLCPFGHVYTSIIGRDWPGSWLEMKASDPTWRIQCRGAMPTDR